jgi:hypothetical protein
MNMSYENLPQDERGDPFYDRISQSISRYGWRVICVIPDPDEISNSIIRYIPFLYTIGNYECGLPELLMIGSTCGATLNAINERMRENNRAFADGEAIELGGACKPKAFWANDEGRREYTVQVGEYYGTDDYAVQQIVIPDFFGRYPGDPKCDRPFRWTPLFKSNGGIDEILLARRADGLICDKREGQHQ